MKLRTKAFIIVLLALVTIPFVAGCSYEKNPYKVNNSEGYRVSVKYDANGGTFDPNHNSPTVMDTYNLSELNVNSGGKAEIALLAPDNPVRGKENTYSPTLEGHFFAGWYTERTENTDENGEIYYTYSGRWDFEKGIHEVDPNGKYSADEPVLTLYAAWIPKFKIELYAVDTQEVTDSIEIDPTKTSTIVIPAWDEETGVMNMELFPKRDGFTFEKAYYDAEMKNPVDTESITHPGEINYENATVTDPVMRLYVEWTEGNWYRINNEEQFFANAAPNASFDILADLDLEGRWPENLITNNYSGTFKGNGHTIKNVAATQDDIGKMYAGLFGNLTENSSILDVTFENVTFTIEAGTRVPGTGHGLLVGNVSSGATLSGVAIKNGILQLDSGCFFGAEPYSIGLVCGMGDPTGVDADIKCETVGKDSDMYTLVADGNTVTVQDNTAE